MKKSNITLLLMAMALGLASCVQKSKHHEVLAQRDTLMVQNSRNEAMMAELQTYIEEITMSLDSIAYHESILFLPDPETPNKATSKKVLQKRLEAFQELIDRQQAKIQTLEDSLNVNNANLQSIKSLLSHMQGQIEQKNVQIEQMKEELQVKEADIRRLKTTVATLESDVSDLQQQTKDQEEILVFQNDLINEAYFLMGSKKELTSWGAMSSGKASANPDLNNFIKVDIRYFTELEVPSAKPKILTTMPASSYSLEKNSDKTTTLRISDPAEFWKASKILIIQLR